MPTPMGDWFGYLTASGRRLARATKGGVAVIGALSLSVMIGMGAFAIEISQGYSAKTNNQRIADMAALAGALAYNVNSNSAEMIATTRAVVRAQGLQPSDATVALTTDSATGKQLVQVTVTTSVSLSLARVFTSDTSYTVSAVAFATTTSTTSVTPPCIAALASSPTYGVTMDGGTMLSAPGCSVDANAGITVPWGTYITAQQANSGKSVSNPGSGLTTSPTANNIVQNKVNAATDWMKDDSDLKGALCKVNRMSGASDADYPDGNTVCTTPLVTPTAVSGGAQNWNLNYSPSGEVQAAWFNSSTNTYTIPAHASGGREIATLTISGGITAIFQGPTNLTITSISMGGTALHFPNGNMNIAGRITVSGGAVVTFDVGVGNTISIGQTSGTSINVGGGSKLCFTPLSGSNCAAPTAAAGTFSLGGSVVTSGGSQVVFPKAVIHAIDGNLSSSGSMTFGSGTYFVDGNFTNSTGGAMTGTDLTFALSGTVSLAGGTSLDLAAPTSVSSYGVPGLLFATKTSAATSIGGGATGRYAGLLYAPKSSLTISGGASVSANASNCLMMILNTITLTGGGTSSTGACSALTTSGTSANVALFR